MALAEFIAIPPWDFSLATEAINVREPVWLGSSLAEGMAPVVSWVEEPPVMALNLKILGKTLEKNLPLRLRFPIRLAINWGGVCTIFLHTHTETQGKLAKLHLPRSDMDM